MIILLTLPCKSSHLSRCERRAKRRLASKMQVYEQNIKGSEPQAFTKPGKGKHW